MLARQDYEQINTRVICIVVYVQFYNWGFLQGGYMLALKTIYIPQLR
jgi:hypothetical protein